MVFRLRSNYNRNSGVIVSCLGPDTDPDTGSPLLRAFSVTTSRIVAFDDGTVDNRIFGEFTIQVWRPFSQ